MEAKYGKTYRSPGNVLVFAGKQSASVDHKIQELMTQETVSKKYGKFPLKFKCAGKVSMSRNYVYSIVRSISAFSDVYD